MDTNTLLIIIVLVLLLGGGGCTAVDAGSNRRRPTFWAVGSVMGSRMGFRWTPAPPPFAVVNPISAIIYIACLKWFNAASAWVVATSAWPCLPSSIASFKCLIASV